MPNTIAQNLQRLVAAKDNIAAAIKAKGGTVPSGDGLEEYPADISTIPPYEMTGDLPMVFKSDGGSLRDYAVKGKNGGIGERTANLLFKKIDNASIDTDGTIRTLEGFAVYVAEVTENQTYTLTGNSDIPKGYDVGYYTTEPALNSSSYNGGRYVVSDNKTFTAPISGYVACRAYMADTKVMLNTGSTALPHEPYGYKIPITCGNAATNLYTPTKLYEGDVLTYADTGTVIPTIDGVNVLDTSLDVKPSMFVQYGDFAIYDNISAAINTLKGTNTTYKPADMADEILDAIPDVEVSGSVVSITDAAKYAAEKLEFRVEPVQDLHGYDKPWPAGGNYNLLAPGEAKTVTLNGVTITSNGKGVYTVSGTASANGSVKFNCTEYTVPNGNNCTLLLMNDGASESLYFTFGKDNDTIDNWTLNVVNRAYYGFQLLSQKQINFYKIEVSQGSTYNMIFSPMFVLGNVTSNQPPFAPYSNICPISGWTGVQGKHSGADITQYTEIPITFPTEAGTVYGGKADVVNGKLTAYPEYDSYNGETLTGEWISDRDVYAAGATPTIGAQVVDLSGVGTEYDITPQQVQMLLGDNNVWCDTGNTTLKYKVDLGRFIEKLQAAQATPQLSLSRQAVNLDAPMDETTQNEDEGVNER